MKEGGSEEEVSGGEGRGWVGSLLLMITEQPPACCVCMDRVELSNGSSNSSRAKCAFYVCLFVSLFLVSFHKHLLFTREHTDGCCDTGLGAR